MRQIRVVQWGLGAMGSGMARLMAGKSGLQLVGGIDSRPDYVGQDLGTVLGIDPLGGSGSIRSLTIERHLLKPKPLAAPHAPLYQAGDGQRG